MEISNLYSLICLVLVFVLVPALYAIVQRKQGKRLPVITDEILFLRKVNCYEELTGLLLQYFNKATELANEYRYVFNHTHSLTEENETVVEELIVEFESAEKVLRQKMSEMRLIAAPSVVKKIQQLLPEEKNKRHISTKDLYRLAENSHHETNEIVGLMQADLGVKNHAFNLNR